jgi:hypothetical protein
MQKSSQPVDVHVQLCKKVGRLLADLLFDGDVDPSALEPSTRGADERAKRQRDLRWRQRWG